MRKIIKIGALTSKPYSFRSRSWELKNLESIDLQDSLGSNIKINYRGSEIMRILPNINEFLNEEWITDKCRFSYDAINRWRFDTPLLKENGVYTQYSWKEIFDKTSLLLKNNNVKNILCKTGPYTSLETLTVLKKMLQNKNFSFSTDFSNNDLINQKFLENDFLKNKSNKVFIFVGTNLRLENPILNLKFRRSSKKKNILIFNIGGSYDNTCYMYHIGNNIKHLYSILEKKHYVNLIINKFLNKNNNLAKDFQNNVNVILGNNIFNRVDSNQIIDSVFNFSLNLKNKIKVFLLPSYMGYINSNYINFNNNKSINLNTNTMFYLLGSDVLDKKKKKSDLILFQGHHNIFLRKELDIIFPSKIYLETNETYLNCINVLQKTRGVNSFFKKAKEDWKILKFFSKYILNIDLPYRDIDDVRKDLTKLIGKKKIDKICNKKFKLVSSRKKKETIYKTPIKNIRNNYHLNTSLDFSSKIMNSSAKEFYNNNYVYLWS